MSRQQKLCKISAIQFRVTSPEEIIRSSVAEITEISTHSRGIPRYGSLSDVRMGSTDRRIICATCHSGLEQCPGHFGHIILPVPVLHPMHTDTVLKILRSVCYFCSRARASVEYKDAKTGQMMVDSKLQNILAHSKKENRFKLMTKHLRTKKVCAHCEGPCPEFERIINLRIFGIASIWTAEQLANMSPEERRMCQRPLNNVEIYNILKHIPDQDIAWLGFNARQMHPKNFMITALAVPPPCLRPHLSGNETAARTRGHNDLTKKLLEVLKFKQHLEKALKEHPNPFNDPEGIPKQVNDPMTMLQYHVTTYLHNEIKGMIPATHRNGAIMMSLNSRLKGKAGRIRGNLMGKRVNFSSRTVVSPDPNIDIDQVGIPKSIALILTIPERVNQLNMTRLRERIITGSGLLHGAHTVIDDAGNMTYLEFLTPEKRRDLSLRVEDKWIVERYLQDNDYVLFNRQPSLHKKSIMAHRVKIFHDGSNTFRLNLSAVTPYNADFDGDETNVHAPQSLQARGEAKELMAISKQIFNGQTNRPTFGLVQDVLIGAYLLTNKNTYLDRETMMQMMMPLATCKLPEPAILKPKPLWTGKQLFSLLLPNVNFSKAVRNLRSTSDYMDHGERSIVIDRGQLLCGAVCKQSINGTGGLVHIIAKDSQPTVDASMERCCRFFNEAQRVINAWLMGRGFSVGLSACVAEPKIRSKVREILDSATDKARQIHEALQPTTGLCKQDTEVAVSTIFRDVLNQAGEMAQSQLSENNPFNVMNLAGSKGTHVNLSQIVACVGQQTIDGKRIHVPGSLKRKHIDLSTRPFAFCEPGQENPRAHGMVMSSYADGLTLEEQFVHNMGGREGLVDTAVKTSTTGYIQRRLIKATESNRTHFSGLVCNAEQYVIEFRYGADGMDPQFLEPVSIPLIKMSDLDLAKHFGIAETPQEFVKQWLGTDQVDADSLERHLPLMTRHFQWLQQSDPQWRKHLDTELSRLKAVRDLCRQHKKNTMTGEIDGNALTPVHIPRQMLNIWRNYDAAAWDQHEFHRQPFHTKQLTLAQIAKRNDARIKPSYLMQVVTELILELRKKYPQNGRLYYETLILTCLCSRQLCMPALFCSRHWTVGMLHQLLDKIRNGYESCLTQSGESVGALASESIGEPSTQLTLNSVAYETEIFTQTLDPTVPAQDSCVKTRIGKMIDAMMSDKPDQITIHPGQTEYLDIRDRKMYIQSVDNKGRTSWQLIEAVTRHPPSDKGPDGGPSTIKVTTKGGRMITASTAKSFLLRRNNELVPVNGCELKVGDYLPVCRQAPKPLRELEYLDLSPYLPKTEYVYGTEMKKMKHIQETQGRRWFQYGKVNQRFTVPYRRSDAAMEGYKKHLPKYETVPNFVISGTPTEKAILPEHIPLDSEFGFLIGAYLAEGCTTNFQLIIANNDQSYRDRIRAWANRYLIGTHDTEKVNELGRSCDIRLHCKTLTHLMVRWCGKGAAHKFVPEWALIANETFVKGLLDGYFAGDGSVQHHGVVASSVSRQLIEGIENLCRRFGVYCRKVGRRQQTHNNRGSQNILPIFTAYCSSEHAVKFAQQISVSIGYKQKALDEIKERDGSAFSNTVIPGIQTETLQGNVQLRDIVFARRNASVLHNDAEMKLLQEIFDEDVSYDPIMEIEPIQEPPKYLYDLTVANTRNLQFWSGLIGRDTFHLAGIGSKNVSLGIPRMREITDFTQHIKTPSMTIYLTEPYQGKDSLVRHFAQTLPCTMLKDIVSYAQPVFEPNLLETLIPEDQEFVRVSQVFRNAVQLATASRWVMRFALDQAKCRQRHLTPTEIGLLIAEKVANQGDVLWSQTNSEHWTIRVTLFQVGELLQQASHDPEEQQQLECHLVQSIMQQLLGTVRLCGVPGINNTSTQTMDRTVVDPSTGQINVKPEIIIDTEGSALMPVWACDAVDWTRTVTNDIAEIYKTCGIEAAVTALFFELRMVLSYDGCYVNDRHLMLVVNTMCLRGYVMPTSRHGMNRIDTGVTAKASFEESTEILMNAAAFYVKDQLRGVTENIMVGELGPFGTGTVQLLAKPNQARSGSGSGSGSSGSRKRKVCKSTITEWVLDQKQPMMDDLDQCDRIPSPMPTMMMTEFLSKPFTAKSDMLLPSFLPTQLPTQLREPPSFVFTDPQRPLKRFRPSSPDSLDLYQTHESLALVEPSLKRFRPSSPDFLGFTALPAAQPLLPTPFPSAFQFEPVAMPDFSDWSSIVNPPNLPNLVPNQLMQKSDTQDLIQRLAELGKLIKPK